MPGPAFLRDETVELRTVEEEDLEFVRDHINDPEVWRTLGSAEPHNLKAEEEWFETISGEDDDVHLLVCIDGEPVGSIGLHLARNWGLGELGYWIAPTHWGNGYCTAAVRLVVGYAFDHRRLHKLAADVYDHNPGSARVLEKVGFEREGVRREEAYVDGEYRDLLRYGLLEGEFER
jgi:RimJ/RimL family protein N-acetyltransferase